MTTRKFATLKDASRPKGDTMRKANSKKKTKRKKKKKEKGKQKKLSTCAWDSFVPENSASGYVP
jgi:hypothetical protein